MAVNEATAVNFRVYGRVLVHSRGEAVVQVNEPASWTRADLAWRRIAVEDPTCNARHIPL